MLETAVFAECGGTGRTRRVRPIRFYRIRVGVCQNVCYGQPPLLGNEIILTAFISIKDDVDAQCEAIRRLHAVGEAAIVLYYVGYYMENVDQKLVQVANELDFPLIVMPRNDYSLRYSDVITEVLMHIFRDQQNETRFATQLLRQISMMREQQRSISGILRLLSDRCQYTFLLVDEDGKECGFAPWPMSINEEFRNSVYDHIDESDDFPSPSFGKTAIM